MRAILLELVRSSVSFQIWKWHRACHDILILSKTSCSDPAAAGPECECPIQSAFTSRSTRGSLLGFQNFFWIRRGLAQTFGKFRPRGFSCGSFRGFQKFVEVFRGFSEIFRVLKPGAKASGMFCYETSFGGMSWPALLAFLAQW